MKNLQIVILAILTAVSVSATTYANEENQNNIDNEMFKIAIADGNIKSLKELINAGADVDATDNSGVRPLHYAILYGHLEAVEQFINAGADVDAADNSGKRPLDYAILVRDNEIAEILTDAGADISSLPGSSETSLHLAIRHGSSTLVEKFINKSTTDINARDGADRTSLDVVYRYRFFYNPENKERYEEIKDLIVEKGGTCSFFSFGCRLWTKF